VVSSDRQRLARVPLSREATDIHRMELVLPLENDVQAFVIVEPRQNALYQQCMMVEGDAVTKHVEQLRDPGGYWHNGICNTSSVTIMEPLFTYVTRTCELFQGRGTS